MNRILVWDWPVRIGHWLMAAAFVIAWLTAESDRLHGVHVAAGTTVLTVAAFRVVWGFVGSAYARFADFVKGPGAVAAYLRSLASLRPQHHTGHNPAGGWAIVALLALALLTGGSGWLLDADGGHWLEEAHEALAGAMLGIVLLHLAGVFAGSLAHRENLVRAMLTGRKAGKEEEGLPSARPWAALVLLVWVGLAGWLIAG